MVVVIYAEKRIHSCFWLQNQNHHEREREREREGELLHEVKHPLRNVNHMRDLQSNVMQR